MFNRTKTVFAFWVFLGFFGSAVYANAEGLMCDDAVDAKMRRICCTKKTKRLQRRCLNNFYSDLKKVRKYVGRDLMRSIRKDFTSLKEKGASIKDTRPIANPICRSSVEVSTEVDEACCGLKYKDSRRACLKDARKGLRKVRKYVSRDFYSEAVADINGKIKSKRCGDGGIERANKCDTWYGLGNGFLWKQGEAYGHVPVALMPIYKRASACLLEDSNGNKTSDMWCSAQSANPFAGVGRQHWRARYGCRAYKKPTILRCKFGTKWGCWRISDPCAGRIE